ncbi:MAG: hypothetical protein HS104_41515 [Polyangiaceae bacterium]|nr:hypothetical protein [Polyangiaceae bacterium]MCL4752054.1 hypothetical protein [Myxococcales bacterium]
MASGAALAACGDGADEADSTLGVEESPAVYCPDFSQTLPMTQSLPWGAVGFLNNGCSATLIDGYHVLAAAHCARNSDTAEWQPNLRFYPNFHPSRVDPPRYRVARSVTGYLAEVGGLSNQGMQASDWAIMRLDCEWNAQHTQQWCPPVAGFPTLAMSFGTPTVGEAVSRAGYDRDKTKLSPDALCPPANATDEVNSCPGGACPCDNPMPGWNRWWQNGFVDPTCTIASVTNDELVSNCSMRGGASGSPLVAWNVRDGYVIRGVMHGTSVTTPENVPCEDAGAGADNTAVSPGARRFAQAPQFARNVAITRHASGTNRTQVWAVDGDADQIRTRSRNSASLTDGWSHWSTFGSPASANRIAAIRLANNYPQLLVTTTTNGLYHREVQANGAWSAFVSFGQPSGHVVRDVDAALDSAGRPYFFGAEDVAGGWAWRRRRTGSGAYDPWASWELLISGWVNDAYRSISAIRRHGDLQQMAFLVTTTGAVKWMAEPFPVVTPTDFAAPASIVDIDAGWLSDNRVFVVAVDNQGHLWIRGQTATSGNSWYAWISFDAPLGPPIFAPAVNCSGTTPPGIVSVTASRWQDDPVGTVVPVIFATDDRGNVYYTTWETGPCTNASCDCGTKWLPWKSFYHTKRWADY